MDIIQQMEELLKEVFLSSFKKVNYKELSFLFSVSLHLIMVGGLIFLNKGDMIKEKDDIFFVKLVTNENIKKSYEEKIKYEYLNKEKHKTFYSKNENRVEQINEEDRKEANFTGREQVVKETNNENFEIPVEKIEVKEKVSGGQIDYISETEDKKGGISDIYKEGMSSVKFTREKEEIVKVDLNRFLDSEYFKLIKKKIDEKIFYPEIARKRNIEGKTKIQFVLKRNGELDEIEILKSSGKDILDITALEIVKKATPFPELPKDVPFEKIVFTMEFNFKLK